METSSFLHSAAVTGTVSDDGAPQHRLRVTTTYLRRDRGLLLAAALATIGLLAGWRWLGAAALLPLLYVLPCAVVMVICMRGHRGSGHAPTQPDSNAVSGPDTRPSGSRRTWGA
jgi:hypothetical protein